jgi:dolichyl-phosphate-mannose--protein O-mannosyl transferase
MLATLIILMLSIASVVFYLRFLVALWKDSKLGRGGLPTSFRRLRGKNRMHLPRLRASGFGEVVTLRELKPEMRLNHTERTRI